MESDTKAVMAVVLLDFPGGPPVGEGQHQELWGRSRRGDDIRPERWRLQHLLAPGEAAAWGLSTDMCLQLGVVKDPSGST